MGINVLSLFDGMSCGQMALERAGISVDNYYASEIKPHAIAVAKENYPRTIHIGPVEGVDVERLPRLDLLLAGTPCKGVSRLNQRQQGLLHPESRLFWEYNRIRRQLGDVEFLLECTHGNKEATATITDEMGISPLSINSKLVSAQNRPRYYWTNIPCLTMPKDKGITTADEFLHDGEIVPSNRVRWLESESGQKSVKKGYTRINPFPKSGCITANGHKKWNENYLLKDGVYRFLSVNELESLQTVEPGYCKSMSYDDAYDVLGDGWTVDVIAHILNGSRNAPD